MEGKVRNAPSRENAELGVHSLDHFAMSVPDLAEATAFYTAFGLDVRPHGKLLGMYTGGQSQCWGLLLERRSKQLQYLSFGIFEHEAASFKAQLERQHIRLLDPPPDLDSDGIWFADPDGLLIQLRVAAKTSPDFKAPATFSFSPGGVADAPKRSQARFTRPSRLGHCLTFTHDVPSAIEFYSRVLGLRLSDRSGNNIAFMHGIHGSDHHLIAFAKSSAPGLHHCSWDVASVDEIGLGAIQMADKGYVAGWGMGRHVLGSNYFHYVRDPWGSHCEYSCNMDYIPADMPWQAADHDGVDAFYVWGPSPPRDWTHNHEADQTDSLP